MNILCICPIGIGNYLLCYPAWVHLKKQLPNARLHLCALRKQITDLAAPDPLWSDIHCIEPTKKPPPSEMFRFIAKLRSYRFDVSLAYFPANTWQYNLLPLLAGCKKRYAFRYPMKRLASLSILSTHTIPVDISLHDVNQNLALSSSLSGVPVNYAKDIVFPDIATKNDMLTAEALLSPKTDYIAIHPGSSAEHGMDAKRWAPERFGMLADRICTSLNATALIFGGPDEEPLKKATAAAMKQPPIIVTPQPLPVTAALLKRAKLCVANDSGIMHLAACSGTPVAALFGPTDELRNGPYGPRNCILRKEMAGFPLWTARNVGVRHLPAGIDPNRSLSELSVDDAWRKLEPFLQQLDL